MKQGDVFKRCTCKRSQWPRCEHPYWHSVKLPNATKPRGFEHKRESLGLSTLGEAREPVSKEKVNELWRATCTAAGVENLTMHDLRRTFGSRFLEAGNDVHAVRDVLGHSSVTMTNTYLSTEEAQQAEAFERFESAERRRKLRVLKHA